MDYDETDVGAEPLLFLPMGPVRSPVGQPRRMDTQL